jgi:1-acyl-sn-glycerol-3-phosphate acyltransferase
MNLIRSIIFYILFFGVIPLLGPAFLVAVILNDDSMIRLVTRAWWAYELILIRKVLCIEYEIQGLDVIKRRATPCIIASKHQSMLEAFVLMDAFGDSATSVIKKQLTYYPALGRAARALGLISIDRNNSLEAVKQMMKEGRKALQEWKNILIFPEGTRVAPLAPTEYKEGLYMMYKALNVPVVTIALNTGVVWPTKSFIKKAGKATFQITHTIEPGLSKEDFQKALWTWIEEPSLQLCQEVEAR